VPLPIACTLLHELHCAWSTPALPSAQANKNDDGRTVRCEPSDEQPGSAGSTTGTVVVVVDTVALVVDRGGGEVVVDDTGGLLVVTALVERDVDAVDGCDVAFRCPELHAPRLRPTTAISATDARGVRLRIARLEACRSTSLLSSR
jgi:hypothetical protein